MLGFQWRQTTAGPIPESTVSCIGQRPSGTPQIAVGVERRFRQGFLYGQFGFGTPSARGSNLTQCPPSPPRLPRSPMVGRGGTTDAAAVPCPGRRSRCHLLRYWRRPLFDQHDLAFQNNPIVAINRAVDLVLRFAANQGQQSHNDLGAARYQRIPAARQGDNFLPDLEAVARHGGIWDGTGSKAILSRATATVHLDVQSLTAAAAASAATRTPPRRHEIGSVPAIRGGGGLSQTLQNAGKGSFLFFLGVAGGEGTAKPERQRRCPGPRRD